MVTGVCSTPCSLDSTCGSAAQSRRGSSTAADLVAMQASSETEVEIGITTKDGDTVTISLQSEVDAGYAYYRRTGTAAGSDQEARALVASASQELQVTVQGSLDDQELADIASLVKQLGQAIRSFVKGDTTASASQALATTAPDSLAGFSLDMEHSDSLTLIGASATTQTRLTGTAASDQPAAQPSPALPSADGEASASSAAPQGAAQPGPAQPDVTGILDAIRKSVQGSGLDLNRSGRVLVRALQQLLKRIADEPANRPARPALAKISSRLPGHLNRTRD